VHDAPRHPVPVFPLPELVLFPHAAVPLHVFELRYRTMVRDALSKERHIALAVLKPGYEHDYQGSPEFHPIGCLARFDEVEWLPNDCYNLRVVGVARVRFEHIVREFPYRSARVRMLPQDPYTEDDPLVAIEKRALLELYGRLREAVQRSSTAEALAQLPALASSDPYEIVVNALCMLSGGTTDARLALLQQNSVIERGRRVRDQLEGRLKPRPKSRPEGGEHN
jgi:Lon protease-like protein